MTTTEINSTVATTSITASSTINTLSTNITIISMVTISTTTETTTTVTTDTSTTSSTKTSTTTTSSTSTTTAACPPFHWNRTGTTVAGTGSGGTGPTQFSHSECLVITNNNTHYVCDHDNSRIQQWLPGATIGTTVAGAGTGGTPVSGPLHITFDKNGYMYVSDDQADAVLRFPPNSPNGTKVAGVGGSGAGLSQLSKPTGIAVDDNLNLYVVDSNNKRIMKWAPGATTGTVAINNLPGGSMADMQFVPNSTDTVYLSDPGQSCVYMWAFNHSSPMLTLRSVSDAQNTLSSPQGLAFDSYNNLYVVDSGNNRVVVYCSGSTVGVPVIGMPGTTPMTSTPMEVAFDSDFNLYVVVDANRVIRYPRY